MKCKHFTYPVINLQSSHNSRSWNNGLYVIKNKSESEFTLMKLDKNLELMYFENGSQHIVKTSVNNTDVKQTSLFFISDTEL